MRQKPIHPAMQPYLDGKILCIDKPLQWTSFDAVKKIRILTGVSKVGHAGTLDPLASGLLIICTGKYTKKINEYMAQPKEYIGTFTLGAITPTYDLESQPGNFKNFAFVSESLLHENVQLFTGEIMQKPPMHSAIKKEGKPLYLAARKGLTVEVEPRPVTIYSFEIIGINLPEIDFKIVCSTGTYIRSLAHDFGEKLGTGAYLSKLCRTRIGDFTLANALSINDFEKEIKQLKEQY